MFTPPTIAEFKAFFVRDFPYGTDPNVAVLDADIQKGLDEANFNFNADLFDTQANYALCYLYLAAHYMVLNLRASSQGIAGNYSWLENSKSVGSVSQSFSIPPRILNSPVWSLYTKTMYGAKYVSLVFPLTVGAVFSSHGRTHA